MALFFNVSSLLRPPHGRPYVIEVDHHYKKTHIINLGPKKHKKQKYQEDDFVVGDDAADDEASESSEKEQQEVTAEDVWQQVQHQLLQSLHPDSEKPDAVLKAAFKSLKCRAPTDPEAVKRWTTAITNLQTTMKEKNVFWLHEAFQKVVDAVQTRRGDSHLSETIRKAVLRLLRKVVESLLQDVETPAPPPLPDIEAPALPSVTPGGSPSKTPRISDAAIASAASDLLNKIFDPPAPAQLHLTPAPAALPSAAPALAPAPASAAGLPLPPPAPKRVVFAPLPEDLGSEHFQSTTRKRTRSAPVPPKVVYNFDLSKPSETSASLTSRPLKLYSPEDPLVTTIREKAARAFLTKAGTNAPADVLQCLALHLQSGGFELLDCLAANHGRHSTSHVWKVQRGDELRVLKQCPALQSSASRSALAESQTYQQLRSSLPATSVAFLTYHGVSQCGGFLFLELEYAESTLKEYMRGLASNPATQIFNVIRELILSSLLAYITLRSNGGMTEDNADNLFLVTGAMCELLSVHVTHLVKLADLDSCVVFADNVEKNPGSLTLHSLLKHLSRDPSAKRGGAKQVIYVDARLQNFFKLAGKLVPKETVLPQEEEINRAKGVVNLVLQHLYGLCMIFTYIILAITHPLFVAVDLPAQAPPAEEAQQPQEEEPRDKQPELSSSPGDTPSPPEAPPTDSEHEIDSTHTIIFHGGVLGEREIAIKDRKLIRLGRDNRSHVQLPWPRVRTACESLIFE